MLRRMKIPAGVAVALLLLYTLIGFFAVPPLARSLATDFVADHYGLALDIERIRFNPFSLRAEAEGVRLDDASGERLAGWDRLVVDAGWRSLRERAIVLQTLDIERPFLHVGLLEDGSLNLVRAFRLDEAPEEPPGEAPVLIIDELRLEGGRIRVTDRREEVGLDRDFGPLRVGVQNLSTRPSETSDLEVLRIGIGDEGSLIVSGAVTVEPAALDVNIRGEGIPLAIGAPYLPPELEAKIADGALSFTLHVSHGAGAPLLGVRGDAAVDALAIEVADRDEPVLSWARLALGGIDLGLEPNRLSIEEVRLTGLDSLFRIHADGTTNVSRVLGGADAEDSGEPPETAEEPAEVATVDEEATPPFPFRIERFVLEDSRLLFNDRTIRPEVTMQIVDLEGEASGIASGADARVEARLAGRVGDHGGAEIDGEGAPFADENDVAADVSFTNIEMTDFSPYAGRFVGYEIAQGKMFLELHYTLDGSRIRGRNQALLDQFELGDRVESEDATSLPVRFALSLLRDRHGKIEISLPVEGDIDAPDFRFGHLIGQVIVNTITKIVTAPFSFLATVFGGGADMEYVGFDPGSTELSEAEREKLFPLAEALNERPRLRLEVQGWALETEDGAALRERRLAQMLASLAASGVEPGDLLGTAFDNTFGEGASAALRDELEASDEEAEPDPGSRLEAAMHTRLLAAQPITRDDLTGLAHGRARRVMQALVADGAPADRVFARSGKLGSDRDGRRARLMLDAH